MVAAWQVQHTVCEIDASAHLTRDGEDPARWFEDWVSVQVMVIQVLWQVLLIGTPFGVAMAKYS